MHTFCDFSWSIQIFVVPLQPRSTIVVFATSEINTIVAKNNEGIVSPS